MIQKITTLTVFASVVLATICSANDEETTKGGWKPALPGYEYRFPVDHLAHPDFKTEWWYFTGNLKDDGGRAFGYELTFFRQGVLPPSDRSQSNNDAQEIGRFVQSDFKFAHFAVTDVNGSKFYFVQKTNRGAFGEAGFGTTSPAGMGSRETAGRGGQPIAWIEDWSLVPQPDGAWKIAAKVGGDAAMSIDLRVLPTKAPVIEGTDGVSQKAAGLGNSSHYYSFTRLQTFGSLSLGKGGPKRAVSGESWFDHEWASNQLGSDQVGWDWFCFQFDDEMEMMLYAMRRKDGSVDPVSSGTWIDANGQTTHLGREDFQLRSIRRWKSNRTGADYPVEWEVIVPSRQLRVKLKPRMDNQELVLPLISYWEGAIAMEGSRGERVVKGVGYMELTGYAAALKGLQSGQGTTDTNTARGGR